MVNVWATDVSTPPLAVPPSSWMRTVTVAVPFMLAAGVYVRVPVAAMAGWTAKRLLLLFVTLTFRVWPDSLEGPALTLVAHPAIVFGPQFSRTIWSALPVNEGVSLIGFTVTFTAISAMPPYPSLTRTT